MEQFVQNSNHLKLLITFPDSYQVYDIINPPYCLLFNRVVSFNLSYTRTTIFSILLQLQIYLFHLKFIVSWMDRETIANLSEDFLR